METQSSSASTIDGIAPIPSAGARGSACADGASYADAAAVGAAAVGAAAWVAVTGVDAACVDALGRPGATAAPDPSADDLVVACAALWPVGEALDGLSDAGLLASLGDIERLSRVLETARARRSAEVARRSAAVLGHAGLASRLGAANAAALVARITGSSRSAAARGIRVGEVLEGAVYGSPTTFASTLAISPPELGALDVGVLDGTELSGDDGGPGPLEGLRVAMIDGGLGAEAVDAVARILEPIVGRVGRSALATGVAGLASVGTGISVDELASRARELRDTLDRAGIDDRERELRSRRSLRRSPVVDGMRRMVFLLDPESDAIVSGALDRVLSPRLGGPRFVDAATAVNAERILTDERTTEQLALDALVDLVRVACGVEESRLVGPVAAPVRVTMTLDDLLAAEAGQPGAAVLEGSPEPMSASTARRLACDAGALPVVLGGTSVPVDLGRARRLFSRMQREALAVRDGGCRFWGCDRPPSWCEAHHITEWSRGGPTDLANGVLLCRRHHLLVHDHGWVIRAIDGPDGFDVVPPPGWAGGGAPLPMPPRAPTWLKEKAA